MGSTQRKDLGEGDKRGNGEWLWSKYAIGTCENVTIKPNIKLVSVSHAHVPSCLGGWDWEEWGWMPGWAKILENPISKITKAKWTSGRVSAPQVWSPEFKPSPTKNLINELIN
jgi:hypothetical protein